MSKTVYKVSAFLLIILVFMTVFSLSILHFGNNPPAYAGIAGGIYPGSGYQGPLGYTIDDSAQTFNLTNLSTCFYTQVMGGTLSPKDNSTATEIKFTSSNSAINIQFQGGSLIHLKGALGDAAAAGLLKLKWSFTAYASKGSLKVSLDSSNTAFGVHTPLSGPEKNLGAPNNTSQFIEANLSGRYVKLSFQTTKENRGLNLTLSNLVLTFSLSGSNKLSQDVSYAGDYSFTYGDGGQALKTTTATRLGTPTYEIKNEKDASGNTASAGTIAVLSGSTVTAKKAGSAEVWAKVDVNHWLIANVASKKISSITITKRPITVTAANESKTYGDADPALTYTYTGSLVSGDSFTGALARGSGSNAGTYSITQGNLALNSNYNLTFTGGTFTITQRPITVTATNKSKTYGDPDPALTYTYTGSLVSGDGFTGALARDSGSNAGTYSITQGNLALNSNYNLTFTRGTFTINKRSIAVTAANKSKTYGDADPALTYTYTGSLASGDSFTGALARGSGSNVGTYSITQGNLALNSNYNLTFTGGTFTINERAITVTANNISKGRSQTQDPTLTYSITSGNLVSGDTLSGVLFRATGEAVGTYAISIGTLGNSNYAITFIGAIFTIFDDIAPIISAVIADITSWTNGNVVLTVTTYDEDTAIASVTCNNSATTPLGNNMYSFVATANGTYTFKSTDTSGNFNTSPYTVTNIDKVVPTISFSLNGTGEDNIWSQTNNVFTFSTEVGISGISKIEYRVDSGDWVQTSNHSSYTDTTTGAKTLQFKITSAAGSASESDTFVSKIDKDTPVWQSHTFSTTAFVNASTGVTLEVIATDATSGVKSVTCGSIVFVKSGDSYTYHFDSSGVYEVIITDHSLRTSSQAITIRNIDDRGATIHNVVYSEAYTKTNVPLTFKVTDEGDEVSDPSGVQAVSINNISLTPEGGVYSYTMDNNIMYTIKVIDNVGNISEHNIDIDLIYAVTVYARTTNNLEDEMQLIGEYTIGDTFYFPMAALVQNYYYSGWQKILDEGLTEDLIIAFGKEQQYSVLKEHRASRTTLIETWELEPIYKEIEQEDITFKYTGGDPTISFDLPEGLTAFFKYHRYATIENGKIIDEGEVLDDPPYIAGSYAVNIRLANDDGYFVGEKAVHLEIEKGILTPTLSVEGWTNSVTIYVHFEDAIKGAIDGFRYSTDGGASWSPTIYNDEDDHYLFINTDNNEVEYVFKAIKKLHEVSVVSEPVVVRVDAWTPEIGFTANATSDVWVGFNVLFDINYVVGISGLALIEYKVDDGDWREIDKDSEDKYKQIDSTNGIESYKFRVTNNANIVTESQVFTSKIDKDIPVVTYTANATSNIWIASNITLTVDSVMGCSGIAKVEYTVNDGISWLTLSAQEGVYTITDDKNGTTNYKFRTTSNAGLAGESGEFVSRIDKEVPTISFATNIASDTWTAESIIFDISITLGPSGKKSIEYTTGNNVWTSIIGTSVTDETTNTETYQFRVTNLANVTAVSGTFISKIDKQAPTIEVSTDYDSSWVNSAVDFTLDVGYGISGAEVRYYTSLDATYKYLESSDPYSYYFELDSNINTKYFFEIVTGAGLISTGDTGGYLVRIDKVPPVINYGALKQNDQTYVADTWTDSDVTFSFNLVYGESGGTLYYSLDGDDWSTGGVLTINSNPSNPKAPNIVLSSNQDRHFRFRLVNGAGVEKEVTFGNVKIDKNAPTLSVSATYTVSGADPLTYNSGVWISYSVKMAIASSGIGPSGVWLTYSTDNKATWSDEGIINNGNNDAEFTIEKSQKNDYIFRLTNGVGNYTERTFGSVCIDKTVPTIVPGNIVLESGTQNEKFESTDLDYAGWYISNVVLKFAVGYGISGGRIEYSHSPTTSAVWLSEEIVNNYQSSETNPKLTVTTNTGNSDSQFYYFRVVSGAGVTSLVSYYGVIKVDAADYYVNINQYVDTVAGSDYAQVNVQGQAFKRGQQAEVVIVPNTGYDFKSTTHSDPSATEFSLDIKNANHNISAYFYKHISVTYNNSNQHIKDRTVSPVTISLSPNIPGLTFAVEYYSGDTKLPSVPNAMGVYGIKAISNNSNYIIDNPTEDLTIVYFEGDGSLGSPYKVDKIADFVKINDCYNNPSAEFDYLGEDRQTAYYKQVANITLTSAFVPIESFTGTFDGANFEFVATTFTVNSTFGIVKVLNGGTIKNVGVRIDTLTVQSALGVDVGFIAGKVQAGTITHCYAVGAISINSQASVNIGALAGTAITGSIEHCFADVTISNTNVVRGNIAGIVGCSEEDVEFSGVYAIGQITLTNADLINASAAPFAVATDSIFDSNLFLLDNTYFNGSIVNITYQGVEAADFAEDILECDVIINDDTVENAKSVQQLARIKLGKTTLQGKGNASSPFEIYNITQLSAMDKYLWADYMFMDNIDLAGTSLGVIGVGKVFSGTLEGNGFEIRNGTIDPNSQYIGLFAALSGAVKGLRLINVDINISHNEDSFVYVGGIAGVALDGALIEHAILSGEIRAQAFSGKLFLGGLVGLGDGLQIVNSLSNISVVSYDSQIVEVGGLAGSLSNGAEATNSFVTGRVDATFADRGSVGALVGVISSSTLTGSKATTNKVHANSIALSDVAGIAISSTLQNNVLNSYEELLTNMNNLVGTPSLAAIMTDIINVFSGGIGTSESPYIIETPAQLLQVNNYLSSSFKLRNTINLAGIAFESLGKGKEFTGTFDGNTQNINNITDALFETNAGTIRNIGVSINYYKVSSEDIVFGAVAKVNKGAIISAIISGSINLKVTDGYRAIVGGVVGENKGSIESAHSNYSTFNQSNIEAATAFIGTVAGIAYSGSAISLPTAAGVYNIKGGAIKAGLVVGWQKDGALLTNYNPESITAILKVGNTTVTNPFG